MEMFIALLAVIALVAVIAVFFYNKIIALKVRVDEGWSDIQVQLKRRHDLIGNLVETVKGYAKHEAATLEKVIQARNAAKQVEGQNPAAVQASEKQLDVALKGLNINALSEAYPDLKANTSFNQLNAELADTENKIAASRRFYNTTVMSLNTIIQQFPGNLFAGMAGATKREFFELDETEKAAANKAPEVRF
jgi:LemA protein